MNFDERLLFRSSRRDEPRRHLRAIDLETGVVKWETPEVGNANPWGGTLATATGLVFYGADSGAFVAADAQTGANSPDASPERELARVADGYEFDGRELIGIVSGATMMAFGLPE